MRRMKYHPHGSVLFITFALEEGLLLLCNPLCLAIVKSCLARAQYLYPLTICHFEVEGNHVHLVAVVKNPDDVRSFIRHFKTETSHIFNSILGRNKRTVWCEGYDSPILLTPIRTLIAIGYLYANPSKDNLETSIEHYPGLSSWSMYRKRSYKRVWNRLRRPQFKALPADAHNLRGYTKEAEKLLSKATTSHEFKVEPDAWLVAFGITDESERARWNERIIERVAALEARAQKKRVASGKSVVGKKTLTNERMNTSYCPTRSGRRMWCLSEDRRHRIQFINFFRGLQAKARAIRKRWLMGDFSVPYPLGLYPPSLPKLAEPLVMW